MDTALLKDFGLPVFLLVGLIGILIMVGRWMGKSVVVPMVEAHIGLITDLRASTKKTSEFIALTATTMEELSKSASERHKEVKDAIDRASCVNRPK